MKLIWHIARKDLRRLVLPVALWCLLGMSRAVLPWVVVGKLTMDLSAFTVMAGLLTLLLTMEVCLECLLMAALVHEDNVTGSAAWWMTRPVSGARLLGAKLLGGLLLFVFAPTVTLAAVWVTAGFSAGELGQAIAWCLVTRGLVAVMALGVAALAEDLGQFIFLALVLLVVIAPIVGYFGFERFLGVSPPPPGVAGPGREWLSCIILVLSVVLFFHQYLTRRRERTVVLLGLGLLLMLGVRLGWRGASRPLSRLGVWHEAVRGGAPGEDDGVKVVVTRVDAAESDGAAKLTLQVASTSAPKELFSRLRYVHGEWTLPDGQRDSTLYRQSEPSGRVEADAVRTLAGVVPEGKEVTWTVQRPARSALNDALRNKPVSFQGTAGFVAMRGRVVGELPLKPGAELHAGSSSTRVIEYRHVREKTTVVIEERDAPSMRKNWLDMGWNRGRPEDVEDYYILRDGERNLTPLLGPDGYVGLVAGAMLTGQRQLEVPGEMNGAALIKVRFEADHYFTRPVAAERPAFAPEEKSP